MLRMYSLVRRRGWASAFMFLIVASLLAACSASPYTSSPSTPTSQPAATILHVTVRARDFSFAMPDTLPTGLVDVKVTMRDFSFDTPDTLAAGPLTYQVTNRGKEAHEMVFLRLAAGKTWRDVMAFLQTPQAATLPGSIVGGMGALGPGQTAWLSMDLAPGTYVILCFLPDKSSGLLHVQLGMICSITVK